VRWGLTMASKLLPSEGIEPVDNLRGYGGPPSVGSTAWDRVLAVIKTVVNPGTFQTWFSPTRGLGLDGDALLVAVPNDMFAEWLRSQYTPTIHGAIHSAGVAAAGVRFVPPQQISRPTVGAPESVLSQSPEINLNPRYTFENFVVSSCNQFAHAACLAVSDQPAGTYNPLFLHGGVGLGKTHLMQAIGNRLRRMRGGEATLRYLTSEQFMNELITAIRFEDTPRFRERYRSVDVLLVDDVQFLAGKESTQEEFFHTFNALYDNSKQIVITSDCPPRSIPGLEERLRSRFEWGLIADIQPPDLETKVAILNKMAASRAWILPTELALFIAGQIHSNVRELEGCLTTMFALASIRRINPDLNLAREVVNSLIPKEQEPVTIESILTVVSRHYNLKVTDIKSKGNAQRVAFPRQVAMYLCKRMAGESYPTIGLWFGGKHHTTVMHAVKKIEALRAKDSALNKSLISIEEELR
jgi:chromosomal replication initiator protein